HAEAPLRLPPVGWSDGTVSEAAAQMESNLRAEKPHRRERRDHGERKDGMGKTKNGFVDRSDLLTLRENKPAGLGVKWESGQAGMWAFLVVAGLTVVIFVRWRRSGQRLTEFLALELVRWYARLWHGMVSNGRAPVPAR